MDPFLFALLLASGIAVGWGAGRFLRRPTTERPLHLILGGMGALLGGAMAQLTAEGRIGAIAVLVAGLVAAILLLWIFQFGKGRLAS
jgi:uncharacterized membrane protein YeaQ/YmgE (transglycosylase-associated protein family)